MRTARTLCAILGALTLAACAGLGGSGPDVGALTPPPAQLPPTALGAGDALLGGAGFSVHDPDLDWGDGVLRLGGADGYTHIDLPLFAAPRGRHWGWLTQGRIYDMSAGRTLPDRSDATVDALGAPTLLVLDVADGGWLHIRYGYPDDAAGGLAWTHPGLVRGTRASYLGWDRALDGAQGVVFRNTTTAHNLRDAPSTGAHVVDRLTGDFDMAVLEIRGDWMHVRVSAPPACAGAVAEDLLLGGVAPKVQTGWVFWRSDARGPWVASAAGPRCAAGA